MIINPLASAGIYAVVLSKIMSTRLPNAVGENSYAVYLLSGMLAWSMFADIIGRSTSLFIDNANLLKKVRFPRICLPAILVGSCLLNNALLLLATLVVFWFMGSMPGLMAFWIIPLTIITALFSTGVGLLVAVVNVFVRDVGQVVPVVMQLLFWLTPIVYLPHILPDQLHTAISWNPMYWIVKSYQDIMLFNATPSLLPLASVTLIALVLTVLSLMLFRRASAEMVDVL